MGHGPFSKYSNQITYLDCAFEISKMYLDL